MLVAVLTVVLVVLVGAEGLGSGPVLRGQLWSGPVLHGLPNRMVVIVVADVGGELALRGQPRSVALVQHGQLCRCHPNNKNAKSGKHVQPSHFTVRKIGSIVAQSVCNLVHHDSHAR